MVECTENTIKRVKIDEVLLRKALTDGQKVDPDISPERLWSVDEKAPKNVEK